MVRTIGFTRPLPQGKAAATAWIKDTGRMKKDQSLSHENLNQRKKSMTARKDLFAFICV